MTDESAPYRLPIVRSPTYKAATIDSSAVGVMSDSVGVTIKVTFTSMDYVWDYEELPAGPDEDGKLLLSASPTTHSYPQKVAEFTAIMRPDHAYTIAALILDRLQGLPSEKKQRYGLPETIVVKEEEGGDE